MADVSQQCLRAFDDGQEEVARKLLPTVPHPQSLTDSYNRTLLHFAAGHGWHDMCRLLVEKYKLSPTDKNVDGWSPLHWACFYSSATVVSYLLSLPTVLPTINDKDVGGMSALDWACDYERLPVIKLLLKEPSIIMPTNKLRSRNYAVLSLLSSRMQWSTEFLIKPYSRLFMAGNSGAGKTTLTAAMLSLDPRSRVSHDGQVSGVKTLTAGICPTQCSGSFSLIHDSGYEQHLSARTPIEIFDLAGHPEYYTSHSAVIESLCLESPAVFILMVDLTKPGKQLSKEIYKWSNFIEVESSNTLTQIITVGSHKDVLSSESQQLARKCKFVEATAKDALGQQHFAGFVALDSRQLSSENMEPFLTILTKSIKDLHAAVPEMDKMSFSCHLLDAFLNDVAKVKAISFGDLQKLVSRNDAIIPFSDPVMLTSSLRTLTNRGRILFLRNNDHLSSSCIIIDKSKLLQEINGTLFAPTSFEEHRSMASNTGIVPVSLLHQIFSHYREILVTMLTSLQYCCPVEPVLLSQITTNLSPVSATSDQLLYFPAMVSAERPSDISIAEGFGFCTYCTNRRQCLTQRCHDSLLLDSAYKYCFSMPTPPFPVGPNETLVRKLCRGCTVWKNGIHWITDEGTETILQVSEEHHCISLLVSLNQECPIDSLELRSAVIDTIRSKQKELCSSVEVHEYLISPLELSHVPHLDFSQLTVFAMEDVAKNVRAKKRFVWDTERKKRMSLENLLHFDPYKVLPPTTLQQLFANEKSSEEVPACFFSGKNPLELAEVTPDDLPCSQEGDPLTSATPPSFVPSAGCSSNSGVGEGGAGGANAPPLSRKGGHCPPTFYDL